VQNFYQCPTCASALIADKDIYRCSGCAFEYSVQNEIAFLLDEEQLGWADKKLRDDFYNGLLGKFYQRLMPLLSLPARPFAISKLDWLIFVVTWLVLLGSVYLSIGFFLFDLHIVFSLLGLSVFLILGSFLYKHPHFFHLLWTAIPAKRSLEKDKYVYNRSFADLHSEVQEELKNQNKQLRLLDVSTGTGNSLLRHGWTKINASLTGFDLSETMLRQLQYKAKDQNIPIDLVIGDATRLPFANESFDVVTNYGAINGYTNIELALKEMVRVLKPGGYGVFLDEQLYPKATWIERQYFSRVLSSHNLIHHCPSEFFPKEIKDVTVHQVYEFYYLCIFRKPI
jgi:ubiquinone/menaquinone biosynthesis C-methylase UbiE